VVVMVMVLADDDDDDDGGGGGGDCCGNYDIDDDRNNLKYTKKFFNLDMFRHAGLCHHKKIIKCSLRLYL